MHGIDEKCLRNFGRKTCRECSDLGDIDMHGKMMLREMNE